MVRDQKAVQYESFMALLIFVKDVRGKDNCCTSKEQSTEREGSRPVCIKAGAIDGCNDIPSSCSTLHVD